MKKQCIAMICILSIASYAQAGFFTKLISTAAISSASIIAYKHYEQENSSIKKTIQNLWKPYIGQWHREQATTHMYDVKEHMKKGELEESIESGKSAASHYWHWLSSKIEH